jgi:hypothetical protein
MQGSSIYTGILAEGEVVSPIQEDGDVLGNWATIAADKLGY